MSEKKEGLVAGGKKGGTTFPRYNLNDSIVAAKRLVSKSHAATIAKDIYYSGVLQVSGPRAEVKSSAIKQYGLMLGGAKDGFSASPLAKEIARSNGDELLVALKTAAVSPKIFKGIFDAFQGDTVTKAKLKQRASVLNVHPDLLDDCIKFYLESLTTAGLVSLNGDQVTHFAETVAPNTPSNNVVGEDDLIANKATEHAPDQNKPITGNEEDLKEKISPLTKDESLKTRTDRAIINVSINLDSTLDTEKLEKQLMLLKRYGAI